MSIEFRSEAVAPIAPQPPADTFFAHAAVPLRTWADTSGPFADVRVSCVIPCLNECDNLRLLLPALRAQIEALCPQWEIIVVDDGSRSEEHTSELQSLMRISFA